jgi:hypothetical protein
MEVTHHQHATLHLLLLLLLPLTLLPISISIPRPILTLSASGGFWFGSSTHAAHLKDPHRVLTRTPCEGFHRSLPSSVSVCVLPVSTVHGADTFE